MKWSWFQMFFGRFVFVFFFTSFSHFWGDWDFLFHTGFHIRYTLYILNWRVKDDRKIYTYRQDGTLLTIQAVFVLTIQAVFVLYRVGDIQMQNIRLMNFYVCDGLWTSGGSEQCVFVDRELRLMVLKVFVLFF